jgi:hypothetical protein
MILMNATQTTQSSKRYDNNEGYNVAYSKPGVLFGSFAQLTEERAYTLAEARRMMRAFVTQGSSVVFIHSRKTGACVDAHG